MYNAYMTTIENPKRARQLIDFGGLQYENKLFTDLDAFQEFEGIAYVLVEFKYENGFMKPGQLRGHVTMCDDLTKVGKPTILMLARHHVHDPMVAVDAASCIVERYRLNYQWHDDGKRTVKEVHRWFLEQYGHHGVKNENKQAQQAARPGQ